MPVPGDYDGDGKTDLAVYRDSTQQWLVRLSSTGSWLTSFPGVGVSTFTYDGGLTTSVPHTTDLPGSPTPHPGTAIGGDFDGDGKTDLGVFDKTLAEWFVRLSSSGSLLTSYSGISNSGNGVPQFGWAGQDVPLTGHYDGGGLRSPVTRLSYDAAGRLVSTTDPRGRATTLSYDAGGRLQSVTSPDPDGPTWVLSGGSVGTLTSSVTTYAYDTLNRLTNLTAPLSKITTYTYDSGGRLIRSTIPDPDGAGSLSTPVTTYTYDNLDRLISVVTPLPSSGRATTTYDYDVRDRLVKVTAPDPDGGGSLNSPVISYGYDQVGNLTAVLDPRSNPTTYAYDAAYRLTTVVMPDPDGAGSLIAPVTTYTYDNLDRLTSVVTPLPSSGKATTTYDYDVRDRLIKTTAPDPDASGSGLVSPVTTYTYDDVGNLKTVVDPLPSGNRTTTYVYDNLNRLTQVAELAVSSTAYTTFTYDIVGNRTSVIDPLGNRTGYGRDALDRVIRVDDPLGKAATFVYDNASQLTDTTDRLGRRTTFAYDNLGRQTQERWLTSSGGTIQTVTHTYDDAGNLVGLSDPNATLAFTYDNLGRLMGDSTSGGGSGQPNITLTSSYDENSHRIGLVDNVSSNIGRTTYTYDNLDRLTTLTRSHNGTAGPQVIFGYDNAGRRTSLSRTINGGGIAVNTTYSYDNLNRLTTLTHQSGGGTSLASYGYAYDNGLRLSSEKINGTTTTYSYDKIGQLTASTGTGSPTYDYDINGNRNSTGNTTGVSNRLTASSDGGTSATYSYDNEGNRTARTSGSTVTTYAYDQRDRLTGVTVKTSGSVTYQVTYTYDALDRRIGFKIDADGAGGGSPAQTWTVYDGDEAYADFNGSAALLVRYLHGPAVDELISRTDSGGTTSWYLTDRQGSVRNAADTLGGLTGTIAYDGFGQITSSSGSGLDRFGYTGREFDSTTKLQYNRARYYDAAIGRWTQEDPIGFAGGDANLYRYVGNSPTNGNDPSGLFGDGPAMGMSPKYNARRRPEFEYRQSYEEYVEDLKSLDRARGALASMYNGYVAPTLEFAADIISTPLRVWTYLAAGSKQGANFRIDVQPWYDTEAFRAGGGVGDAAALAMHIATAAYGAKSLAGQGGSTSARGGAAALEGVGVYVFGGRLLAVAQATSNATLAVSGCVGAGGILGNYLAMMEATGNGEPAPNNALQAAMDRGMKIIRGPNAPDEMVGVLEKLGKPMTRERIREVIHSAKRKMNIGAAEDIIFDKSGGMWDSRTGEYIGKMWESL